MPIVGIALEDGPKGGGVFSAAPLECPVMPTIGISQGGASLAAEIKHQTPESNDPGW
jgi:hypothetical protein